MEFGGGGTIIAYTSSLYNGVCVRDKQWLHPVKKYLDSILHNNGP